MPPDPDSLAPTLGPMLAAVTNAVVRLHAQYYGKGPTRSKSYLLGDVLVCVMEDVFTTVERTLIENGRLEQVRATRAAFQDAMAREFVTAVEEASGRRVLSCVSQVMIDPDVAMEVFLLEPERR